MTTRHLTRKSDAQSNAEALARRGATYADEHARSWSLRMDRRAAEPRTLRDLVHELRKAYSDEMPSRMHVHEVWHDDEDGVGSVLGAPAMSKEMERRLFAPDGATDKEDHYLTPFRAALAGMMRSSDDLTRQRATYVQRIIVGGDSPVEACSYHGAWAKVIAENSLRVFWRRLCDVRLDLAETRTAA